MQENLKVFVEIKYCHSSSGASSWLPQKCRSQERKEKQLKLFAAMDFPFH
jgi:hypothetical protein